MDSKDERSLEGTPAAMRHATLIMHWRSVGNEVTAPGRMRRRSHCDDWQSSGSLERDVGVTIQRTTRATVRGLREDLCRALRNVVMSVLRHKRLIVQTGILTTVLVRICT